MWSLRVLTVSQCGFSPCSPASHTPETCMNKSGLRCYFGDMQTNKIGDKKMARWTKTSLQKSRRSRASGGVAVWQHITANLWKTPHVFKRFPDTVKLFGDVGLSLGTSRLTGVSRHRATRRPQSSTQSTEDHYALEERR